MIQIIFMQYLVYLQKIFWEIRMKTIIFPFEALYWDIAHFAISDLKKSKVESYFLVILRNSKKF